VGDVVASIEGEAVVDWSLERVAQRLRALPGTITLGLLVHANASAPASTGLEAGSAATSITSAVAAAAASTTGPDVRTPSAAERLLLKVILHVAVSRCVT
jgi:hypothetical protein